MAIPVIDEALAYFAFGLFGSVALIYVYACGREWYKSTYLADRHMVRYSKKMLGANFFIVFYLVIMYVALFLEQGFFPRELNVYIWWPRSIAYAFSFSTLAYVVCQTLMVRKGESVYSSKAAFMFVLCSMVFGSFTGSDDYHWIYFGLSFVPLIFLFLIWGMRSRRSSKDGVFTGIMITSSLMIAGYVITWGLSPDGSASPTRSSVITQNTAFWIYFALDIFFYVVLPLFCLLEYIPAKYAQIKLRSSFSAPVEITKTEVHVHHHSYPGVENHTRTYAHY